MTTYPTREAAQAAADRANANGRVLDCGHRATPNLFPVELRRCVQGHTGDGWGTAGAAGTCRMPDGRTVCYGCADSAQAADMATADRFTAYLSSDGRALTTWSGGVLARVTESWASRISPSCEGVRFRAVDADGRRWYGTSPGRGMYANTRRAKRIA